LKLRHGILCCLILMLVGTPPPDRFSHVVAQDRVRALLDSLTLEQKVGQLFLITLYSPELGPSDRHLIESIHPGGVVLFPHNIQTPPQVATLTNALQAYARDVGPDVPLLIAVDQEGGRVSRLQDGFTVFPPPLVLGGTASRTAAVQFGHALGQELAAVGINMDLAPVADLHYPAHENGEWEVMHRRTLSSDPGLVGRLAGGVVEGMHAAGVIGVLKHFPGHGAATADSHNELPVISMTREEAESTALAAFAGAIDAGAQAVMVGHLYYPALDPVERPASLSPVVIGLLRGELGFGGVAISDAMQMGGVRTEYELPEAVVDAINAGIDLITFGPLVVNQIESAQAVIEAVRAGRISEDRLNEAVSRSLALRAEYGLLDWSPLDVATTEQRLRHAEHERLLLDLALAAVTVVFDDGASLPLDPALNVAVIYPGIYPNIGWACAQHDPDLVAVEYTLNPTDPEEFSAASFAGRTADRVVVFIEDSAAHPDQLELVEVLPPEKTIVVSMHSPYEWESLPPEIAGYVLTYQSAPEARIAACRVLYGAAPAQGRLPVAVGPYPVGTGVWYDVVRPLAEAGMP
jgi:beta-N-acetylhexosaminidase